MIAYEGGPHLAGTGGAENNVALTALFIAANRSPRMGEIVKRHYENWFAAGGGVYAAFIYVEPPSKNGSWGVLEFQDQPLAECAKVQGAVGRVEEEVNVTPRSELARAAVESRPSQARTAA